MPAIQVASPAITSRVLVPVHNFLRIYECPDATVDAERWVRAHRDALEGDLLAHGAVLLRGFRSDPGTFSRVADRISPRCIDPRGGTAPRTALPGNVFTASELPAGVTIPQHHELAHSLCWPTKLLFYCHAPAPRGGETPLCSARWITQRLSPRIARLFDDHRGITYIRNYRPDLRRGTLDETFHTRSRAEIEALCRRDAIAFEWKASWWLQTRQTRAAFRVHPQTGDRIFVAAPHLWHRAAWIRQLSRLGTHYSIADVVIDDPTTLWMHATYGDGTPIDTAVVDELYDLFEAEKVALPWHARDILILDNLLASHGRNAYDGPRSVLAALRAPYRIEARDA